MKPAQTATAFGAFNLLLVSFNACAFANLDFELANFTLTPTPPGQFGGMVAVSNPIPGWTGNWGAEKATWAFQNDFSLGSASIDILGPSFTSISPGAIIEGQYTVALQAGASSGGIVDTSIAQVSVVPVTANSIQMKVQGINFSVSMAGQEISMVPIAAGTNYTLYAGDISQFAGQIAELKLTTDTTSQNPFNPVYFDSIVFSPQAIPEPKLLHILGVGMLVFGFRWLLHLRH